MFAPPERSSFGKMLQRENMLEGARQAHCSPPKLTQGFILRLNNKGKRADLSARLTKEVPENMN